MIIGTEIPQLLCPRGEGDSTVFVLHSRLSFPSDDLLDNAHLFYGLLSHSCLTSPLPFWCFFTSQIIFLLPDLCLLLEENKQNFYSVSDNVSSISHTFSHLLSFN